jgi:hypothetical protein
VLAATTIYLFIVLSGVDRPNVTVLFKTTSLASCQAQADTWNKQLANEKVRVACVPHAQKALVPFDNSTVD